VVKEHSESSGRYRKTGTPYRITLDQVDETIWKKQANGWVERNAKVLSMRQVHEE